MQFKIRKAVLSYQYYIYNVETNLVLDDFEISNSLNIEIEEYKQLKDKFNCIKTKNQDMTLFHTIDEAQNALDYLNSILVANQFLKK